MSFEILYTSAPQGLRKGSRGYCTVLSTRGIPKTLAERLESRSGYPHPFPPGDPRNPVGFSHLIMKVGGLEYHVVSRIADCGFDYSRRSNKLAHHVALGPAELTKGGPAWVLAADDFCMTEWNGNPRLLPQGRAPRTDPCPSGACRAWERLAGDAGWAGVLAAHAVADEKKTAFVIFKPGDDMLPLLVEALALLPPEDRWRTTFSTYYTKLQSADAFRWRFVLDGTPEAESARRDPRITLIDLARPLERAPDGPYVEFARTGTMPLPTTTEPPTVESPAFVPLGPGDPPPITGMRGPADPPPVGYGYGPATPATRQEDGTEFAAPLPLENGRPTRFHRRQPKPRWWLRLLVALLLVGAGIGLAQLWNSRDSVIDYTPDTPPSARPESGDEREDARTDKEDDPPTHPKSDAEDPSGETTGPGSTEHDKESKQDEPPADSDREPTANDSPGGPSKGEAAAFGPDANKGTKGPSLAKPLKDQLPDCLALPKANPQRITLSPLDWPLEVDEPAKLTIELLGSDSLGRSLNDGRREHFSITRRPSEETGGRVSFAVRHSFVDGTGKPSPDPPGQTELGLFEIEPGLLIFQPKYTKQTIGRYEVLRHAILRFRYGDEERICRLREEDSGRLKLEGSLFEKKSTTWVFEVDKTKGEWRPFRFWLNHEDWKDEPLPARKSLLVDLSLKNCASDASTERTQFHLSLWSGGTCRPIPESVSDATANVTFKALLEEAEGRFCLRVQASSKLAYLTRMDPAKDSPGFREDMNFMTGQFAIVKDPSRFKELVFCDDSVETVEHDLARVSTALERVKDADPENPKQKERKEKNVAEAKKAIAAAKAWLEKAKWFRKELPKRLRKGESEITARLYADVQYIPTVSEITTTKQPGRVKVRIASFSTSGDTGKSGSKSKSSASGNILQ